MHNPAYTLHNHSAGVTADQPHPASEGAEFPLLFTGPESADSSDVYDEGFEAGVQHERRAGAQYREGFCVAQRDALDAIKRLAP